VIVTEWDYTELADAYVHRPGYSDAAIDRLLALAGVEAPASAIDLGSGAGHLTQALAVRGLDVLALEPNDAMRRHGMARTARFANVRWMEGIMQDTRLPPQVFALATCGSSFGVADRAQTLREVARILRPGGSFACIWNHRDLDDPLQSRIESHIRANIPDYRYGTRREDQTETIVASGLFEEVETVSAPTLHRGPVEPWLAAWRSHATLQRQAGGRFAEIVAGIEAIVRETCGETIEVPYTTRAWLARLKDARA
jgi:SAM-dependent methyltransferase